MIKQAYMIVHIVCCLLIGFHEQGYSKIKWEKISDQELTDTSYEEVPEAPAVILFDQGKIIVDYHPFQNEASVVLEKYCRMKILNEQGYNYANIRIRHHESEKIENLEARTVLTIGKTIKVDKKDIHKNDIKIGGSIGNLYETVFTFPALEPGCIIEYKFEKKSKSIQFLDKWFFQNELFTFHSEITAEVSSLFAYNYYLYPPGAISTPKGELIRYRQGGIDMKKARFTWALDSIPAIVQEPLIPPVNSLRTQIFFALSAIRLSPTYKIHVFDSWERVAEVFFKMYNSIRDSKEVKAAVEECTVTSNEREAKIRDIFNYLKKNCTYIKSSTMEVFPVAPNDVLKNGKGDAADISGLMIQMLRDAGIEAYPAVIATRSDPPFLMNFPSPTQFTKMLVYIHDNEKPLWIDPAGSFATYKILPWENQDQTALIINSERGTFAKTPESSCSENVISYNATVEIDSEGSVSVDGAVVFKGLDRNGCASGIDAKTDEEREKYLKGKICPFYTDAEIEKLELPSDLREGDSLLIKYSLISASGAQLASNRLIINPSISHQVSAGSFEAVRRVAPLFFEYPYTIKIQYQINIPQGYRLEESLENIELKRLYGHYMRKIHDKGGILVYQKEYILPETVFQINEYTAIRDFYRRLEGLDGESLVLIRQDSEAEKK